MSVEESRSALAVSLYISDMMRASRPTRSFWDERKTYLDAAQEIIKESYQNYKHPAETMVSEVPVSWLEAFKSQCIAIVEGHRNDSVDPAHSAAVTETINEITAMTAVLPAIIGQAIASADSEPNADIDPTQ